MRALVREIGELRRHSSGRPCRYVALTLAEDCLRVQALEVVHLGGFLFRPDEAGSCVIVTAEYLGRVLVIRDVADPATGRSRAYDRVLRWRRSRRCLAVEQGKRCGALSGPRTPGWCSGHASERPAVRDVLKGLEA